MLLALRLLITPIVSSNFSDAVCQEWCASCPWSDTINKKCRLQNFLLNVSFGTFRCFVVTHMLIAFASQSHHLCFMGTSVTVMAWYVFFFIYMDDCHQFCSPTQYTLGSCMRRQIYFSLYFILFLQLVVGIPVIYAFILEFATNRNGELIYSICEGTNRISNGNNKDILLFLSKMDFDMFKDTSLVSVFNENCRSALIIRINSIVCLMLSNNQYAVTPIRTKLIRLLYNFILLLI